METSIGFRPEGIDRFKSELKDTNQQQLNAQKESLNITIEEARIKSRSDKQFLKSVNERLRVKRDIAQLDSDKTMASARQDRFDAIKEAGPNITSRQREIIDTKAAERINAARTSAEYAKKSYETQLLLLEQSREQAKALSATPEGRAKAKALSLEGSRGIDSLLGANLRELDGGSGSGGIGKMLSGVLGKFGAYLAPLAMAGAAWSYMKSDRQAISSATTGESYLIAKERNLWNTLSFGLGAGDWVTSGKERALQARSDWSRESAGIYGLTGSYGARMGWGNKFGMTSTQLAGDYRQLSEAMLDPTADLESVIAARKGFGLQGGQAMQLASMGLADESSYLRTMGIMTGGGTDRIRYGGLLSAVNQISQAQMQLGGTDTGQNMAMALALNSVGGSFGDARLSSRMSTMNNALTNPSNDFQKMNTYQLLRGLEGMEDASWTDLEIAREKGLAQKGYLQAVMTDAVARGGGRDGAVQNIKSRLGLSTTDADALYEKYKSNPELFENLDELGSEEAVKAHLLGEGSKATSKLEKEKAIIDEAFITSATAGMEAVQRIADMLEQAMVKKTHTTELSQGMNVDKENKTWLDYWNIGTSQVK